MKIGLILASLLFVCVAHANYVCHITRYDNLVITGEEGITLNPTTQERCEGLGASRSLVCVNTKGHNIQLLSYDRNSNDILGSASLEVPQGTDFPKIFTIESQSVLKNQSPQIISSLKCEELL